MDKHTYMKSQGRKLDTRRQWMPSLEQVVRWLTEKERDAFVLWYFHERTFQEIGKALGYSGRVARYRVNCSLKKLEPFSNAPWDERRQVYQAWPYGSSRIKR